MGHLPRYSNWQRTRAQTSCVAGSSPARGTPTVVAIARREAVAALDEFVSAAELDDTRHLIEKWQAIGCESVVEVSPINSVDDARQAIAELRAAVVDALSALHAVIPETGQEYWSEALEHLLEHIMLRKQHQVDYLDRVLG